MFDGGIGGIGGIGCIGCIEGCVFSWPCEYALSSEYGSCHCSGCSGNGCCNECGNGSATRGADCCSVGSRVACPFCSGGCEIPNRAAVGWTRTFCCVKKPSGVPSVSSVSSVASRVTGAGYSYVSMRARGESECDAAGNLRFHTKKRGGYCNSTPSAPRCAQVDERVATSAPLAVYGAEIIKARWAPLVFCPFCLSKI